MNHGDDLDDAHLCIKCNATIVGLEKYVEHRKQNCATTLGVETANVSGEHKNTSKVSNAPPTTAIESNAANLHHHHHHDPHSYADYTFAEPEAPSSYVQKAAEHGGKSAKHMTDAYDLTYELGADVFFSSLQLQSVQSTSGSGGSGGAGKTSSSGVGHSAPLSRQKSQAEASDEHVESWLGEHENGTEATLMKVVHDMSEVKKHYESDFQSVKIDMTSDEDDDGEEDDDEEQEQEQEQDVVYEDDGDDEDYDPREDALAMGIKWKLSPMRHSPPTVPLTHTGGKWRPEHRPSNLNATHLTRPISPNWDEHADELEAEQQQQQQHPPAEHTKGKWVPGSKVQRLEYRENLFDLTATTSAKGSHKQSYWCNICCRKLRRRANYEHHLRTSYHLKRAEPEQQLEKAVLSEPTATETSGRPASALVVDLFVPPKAESPSTTLTNVPKKRKRRAIFYKCELCKHAMQHHLIGKHLISHYHYRRMQSLGHSSTGRIDALHAILTHIHRIVLQSPYQCRFCSFYLNTEAAFLQHWSSPAHRTQVQRQLSGGDCRLYCGYCQYECETNDRMHAHLLSAEHKAVILAVNRSVPICITKRRLLRCDRCTHVCRYNIELREHFVTAHASHAPTGSASDVYQSRYRCRYCGQSQRSRVALQRHEKNKHSMAKYHCGVCKLEFETALKARQHRKSFAHKRKTAEQRRSLVRQTKPAVSVEEVKLIEAPLEIKPTTPPPAPIVCGLCPSLFHTLDAQREHQASQHPQAIMHECMLCNQSFHTAQALGRHTRSCQPTPSTSTAAAAASRPTSWSCNECQFSAVYESDLIYHRLLHTHGHVARNTRLPCPLCPKSFRKHSLRCHLRQHTDEKIFACDRCDLKFARRSNLKNHVDVVHGDKKSEPKLVKASDERVKKEAAKDSVKSYVCDICGKTLASPYTLQLHRTNHTQAERRFVCTYEGCQYAGSTRQTLNVHLASHSEESLKCEHENCDYVGKSVMHLRRHSRTHTTRNKVYACAQCDFKTHSKSHLTRHLRRHSGEKPYQCPHCDFCCSHFDNLRKHILKTRKHPGKFMYECKGCLTPEASNQEDNVFRTNNFAAYQQHVMAAHPENAELFS